MTKVLCNVKHHMQVTGVLLSLLNEKFDRFDGCFFEDSSMEEYREHVDSYITYYNSHWMEGGRLLEASFTASEVQVLCGNDESGRELLLTASVIEVKRCFDPASCEPLLINDTVDDPDDIEGGEGLDYFYIDTYHDAFWDDNGGIDYVRLRILLHHELGFMRSGNRLLKGGYIRVRFFSKKALFRALLKFMVDKRASLEVIRAFLISPDTIYRVMAWLPNIAINIDNKSERKEAADER